MLLLCLMPSIYLSTGPWVASTSHVGEGNRVWARARRRVGRANGSGRGMRRGVWRWLVGPLASAQGEAGAFDRQSPCPLRNNTLASRANVHVRCPPTPAASKPSTPAPGHAMFPRAACQCRSTCCTRW
ncbi:hypothetical protein B0H16DRAFT_792542 [Mycena metata]|uniref:Secreted protein n=1 Tax=Mycena metata TaxID=1033252 RepID=A0AAD7DTI9_9AGAR|nr:hypothetical protein B0H16DRAFT_792542 [Mycena metata]